VGLFDFFRRRSAKESAIPSSLSGQIGDLPARGQAAPTASGPASVPAQPGETVVTHTSHAIDASGVSGLRDSMFEILRRHGIDPERGQAVAIDASSVPGLAEEIQRTLSSHGIQIPGAAWSPEGTPGLMQMSAPPAGADTDDRLRQLTELLQSGLITQAEFEQQRSRIIGDV